MAFRTIMIPIAFAALLSLASANIPSRGLLTAESIRSKLPNRAFRINPKHGNKIVGPNFTIYVADLTKFPALAGVDVQTMISRVFVKAGKELFQAHYHPRSSEIVTVGKGIIRVNFRMESGRMVSNWIHAGESAVVPQGLVHTTVCVSKMDCEGSVLFTSADPGVVVV